MIFSNECRLRAFRDLNLGLQTLKLSINIAMNMIGIFTFRAVCANSKAGGRGFGLEGQSGTGHLRDSHNVSTWLFGHRGHKQGFSWPY